MLVKRIVEGSRAKFGVSVAETDHLDTWQRCQLGFAIVSADVAMVEKVADDIERFIWQTDDTEVLEIEHLWLDTA